MHASPGINPLASPPMRGGSPPSLIAERIIRSRKGNPPQIIFSEMSPEEISSTIDALVEANGLTDAFLLNAIDNRTRRLNLSGCYNIRKYTLGMIPQQCLSLQSIDLSNCRQADSRMVCNLLANCTGLTELILDGCVRITDAAFFPSDPTVTIPGLSRLEKISLASCRQMSEDALLRLANLCPNLRHVSFASCRTSVTSAVVARFLNLARFGRLEYLDISDCAVLSSDETFLSYQTQVSPHTFLGLAVIKLAGLSGLPPKYGHRTISSIAYMCGPNLVEIDTSWCAGITDETCFSIAKNCPNIRRLSLCNSQITANGVELLMTHLPLLERVDFSWCLKVNSAAIGKIANFYGKNLREIFLNNCVDFVSGSTDPSSGGPITPASIHHLLESLSFSSLTRLELGGIAKCVTPSVLRAIADYCPNMTHLTAILGNGDENNPTELESAFAFFSNCCESIINLSIDISRITNQSQDLLLNGLRFPNFPNLSRLCLIANPKCPFGDDLIEAVLVHRIGLEHLELRNAGEVSQELFLNWIQGYHPDREASLVVGAMLDSDLQKGYVSNSSAGRGTVIYSGRQGLPGGIRTSDSEAGGGNAPTVIFRGRYFSRKKKFVNPFSSASETETASLATGFDLLKNSLILSDAARSMDSLKSLTLIGAVKLTDSSIDRLSLMLTYMQDLEIIDSPFLTEECVEPLKRRCKLLRSLHVTGNKLRVKIDSSRFSNRRNRRKPPQQPISAKRKHKESDFEDD